MSFWYTCRDFKLAWSPSPYVVDFNVIHCKDTVEQTKCTFYNCHIFAIITKLTIQNSKYLPQKQQPEYYTLDTSSLHIHMIQHETEGKECRKHG